MDTDIKGDMNVIGDESRFLKSLFGALQAKGIIYAVARRMPSLPESLQGSDLDIMTPTVEDMERLVSTVNDVAKIHNGGFVSVFKGDYATFKTARAVIASLAGRYNDGVWWGMHIDMYVGADFHGLPYMSTEMLMAERRLVDGCYYCLGGLSDVSNFVKEILHNGRMKKNYRQLAQEAFSVNREAARNALAPYFGAKVEYIERLLCCESGCDSLSRARRKLRASVVRMNGFWHATSCRFANLFWRFARFFAPPGYFVAVLGTDGSGKSTIINSIRPFLEETTHVSVQYHHLRPGLLPSLSRLAGKKQKEGPVKDPHGGKPAGRLSSIFRFSYYLIDYILGHFSRIYISKVKRSCIIFGDRWYYEYMIDPRRCAVQLPSWLPRLVAYIIPSPDLILCLGGDAAKIYSRKPETSLGEVERQVKELREFCDGNDRAIWVDTTRSIESSVNDVLMAILGGMRRRYDR